MKARVIKNTAAYMLVGLAPYIVNFFMLPVYSRFMTPADYGIVSLVNAFTSFLAPFIGLKLATSLGRYFFEYDEKGVREFFSTILYAIVATDIALLVLMQFYGDGIARLVFRKADIAYYPYVFLGVITVICSGLTSHCTLLLRVREKGYTILAISLACILVSMGLGLYLVVYRGMGARGMLLGAAVSSAINAGVLLTVVKSYIRPVFRFHMVRKGLAFGVPLIPHALGRVLFTLSDRLVLGFFVPVASIGLYSIADRISGLLGVGVRSFDSANQPTFMRTSTRSKTEAVAKYQTIITKWAAATASTYLLIALFSEEIVTLLTPPRYHSASRFVPILLGAHIFHGLGNFAATAIVFEKKTKVIPLITFLPGVFNVVANLLLIPRFGILAAAWTTVVSVAITFALSLFFSRWYYPIKYEWTKLLRIFGLMVIVFLIVSLFKGSNPWTDVVIKLCGLILFGSVLLKWDYGDIRSDLGHLTTYLLHRFRQ